MKLKLSLPLNKGDHFVPTGNVYSHRGEAFFVEHRFNEGCVPMLAVRGVDTGKRMNMVEKYVFVDAPVVIENIPPTPAPLTDREIILGAGTGDPRAVREFIKRFKKYPKIRV